MLARCTIAQSRELQQTLALIRKNSGHFPSSKIAIDTITGQPYGFEMGTTATNISMATMQLLNTLGQTNPNALILADKEHFTENLFRNIDQTSDFDFLVPVITSERIKKIDLLTEDYADRWSIEDFFNFEGAIGFDRASTLNLNIRCGKMSLALLAQAAMHEFRKKLPQPYKR